MKATGENRTNTTLAFVLVGIGLILLVSLVISLILIPADTLAVVDKSSIKVVLATVALLMVIMIGLLIFWTFHCPTVRRLTVNSWRAILVYTAIACGFSVFGWPRITAFAATEQNGFEAEFSAYEASMEVWPNIAVCFSAIIIMTLIYVLVGFLEAKAGQEL